MLRVSSICMIAVLMASASSPVVGQSWQEDDELWSDYRNASWVKPSVGEPVFQPVSSPVFRQQESEGQAGSAGGNGGGGGGDLAGDATNPTANIKVFQLQNTFVPRTHEASGYANTLGLQAVIPVETRSKFFPTLITRTTLPVIVTADPDGDVPIGPPNDTENGIPLSSQSGLGDLVFISVFNHPTDWGSWGFGPGFVAPTATRFELGEQSWKFSPSFVVVNTSIKTWQFGVLGTYNFPLDNRGSKSLLFQPLIVKQLGQGWYTGWGDDLWSYNSESGNYSMPLQLRVGKVSKIREKDYNIFVTGFYTPEDFHKGPTAEWGIKFSISRLVAGKQNEPSKNPNPEIQLAAFHVGGSDVSLAPGYLLRTATVKRLL